MRSRSRPIWGPKSFDKAVSAFAESYADQTEQDFAAFTGAIADGALSAHEDAGGAEGISSTGAQQRPGHTQAHDLNPSLHRRKDADGDRTPVHSPSRAH